METKANYVLIGAFTIAGFLGLLGFVAWFSKAEIDRDYAYYYAEFENVAGLNQAASVKFAGLSVGQVVDMELTDAGLVRVRLEVDPKTPMRADSTATIEAQGVTGLSYVALSRGAGDPLPEGAIVISRRSVLQSLSEDAPEVVSQVKTAMTQINEIMSPDNIAKFDQIIGNLSSSSEKLDGALTDISTVAANIGGSVAQIANFTDELGGLTTSVEATIETAGTSLASIEDFASKASDTLENGQLVLQSTNEAVMSASNFIDGPASALVLEINQTTQSVKAQIESLSHEANILLGAWASAGKEATERLQQSDAVLNTVGDTIGQFDQTLAAIEQSSASFNTMLNQDAGDLLRDARTALAQINRGLTPLTTAAEQDIPLIIADLRGAMESVKRTTDTMGDTLASATGDLASLANDALTTLNETSSTMVQARQTMGAFERALGTAEVTLETANGAFAGAQRIVDQDLSPLTSNLQGTIGRLNTALDQVNADIPDISTNLRNAARNANAMAERLRAILREADGPALRFANEGLTRYTQLAQEVSELLTMFERIATKIDRNPSRFILGGETPTYRSR